MRRKKLGKPERQTKLKIVENILAWSDLEPLLGNYIDQTVEFVTHQMISAEITRIEVKAENVFVIFYKNTYVYRNNHWQFEKVDEQDFKVITTQADVFDKGGGTIQIKLNDFASIYLKQRKPKKLG